MSKPWIDQLLDVLLLMALWLALAGVITFAHGAVSFGGGSMLLGISLVVAVTPARLWRFWRR